MAKKPTGGLIKGEKKQKMVKMACDWNRGAVLAKYPTGGLTRGEKKQIKSKNGKKTYWRTYKG